MSPQRRQSPGRPNDPVGWREWALGELAQQRDLTLTAERLLRRLTLDAHWRDHTVDVGDFTALAKRLRLGTRAGRVTVSKATKELTDTGCITVDGGVVTVTAYRLLVCPRSRISVDDLANATWIRPAALDRVSAGLSFPSRALLEVMLTLAGRDGIVELSANRIHELARVGRNAVTALRDADLVEHVDTGWRINGYDSITWTPADDTDDQVIDLTDAERARVRADLEARVTELEQRQRNATLILAHAIEALGPDAERWLRPVLDRLEPTCRQEAS